MACNVSQQQQVIEQEMKAALGKIKHKLLIMSGKGGVPPFICTAFLYLH